MEFEVLNDILTGTALLHINNFIKSGTVASLFTNSTAGSTPAYKTSSQMG